MSIILRSASSFHTTILITMEAYNVCGPSTVNESLLDSDIPRVLLSTLLAEMIYLWDSGTVQYDVQEIL